MSDFESLLKRYMKFVDEWEGSDFVFSIRTEHGFSVEEIDLLREMSLRNKGLGGEDDSNVV